MGLHILADENIPRVEGAFSTLGTVRTLSGRAIEPRIVREADVLLVRSVTPVDASLLAESAVQFVGSATIGTDHVDRAYLKAENIAFAHAPGSNATSVVEYVLAALLRLAVRRQSPLRGKTVGVVGCGAIGGRLAARLPAFGVRVLQNDPPRAEREGAAGFASLEQVLAEADIVTLHVPITCETPHATYHLFDAATLQAMQDDAWLVNASRGPVVDNNALKEALRKESLGAVVLDTWENEPTPDPALLARVDVATPHIAGYSCDGKIRGTIMLYRALCEHLDVEETWDYETLLAPGPADALDLVPPDPALPEPDALDVLTRQMYDIGADDRRMRALLDLPAGEQGEHFVELRRTYPHRRSFSQHRLSRWAVTDEYQQTMENGLNVQFV